MRTCYSSLRDLGTRSVYGGLKAETCTDRGRGQGGGGGPQMDGERIKKPGGKTLKSGKKLSFL